MFVSQVVQGRWLRAEDVEVIRCLIAEHPHWSRRRLSVAVSDAFNWRTASGQLKDMSARLLLAKLAERGIVKLPPRQRRGGGRTLRALSQPELFWAAGSGQELIEGLLEDLRPLELILIEPRTKEANDFVCYLERDHYLGFGGASGHNLRYLIRDCYGRDLACVLFGGAAWKVKARDGFIGWSAQQRQQRLSLIVNNSRFLILSHVRVPHLASHILGIILRACAATGKANTRSRPAWRKLSLSANAFLGSVTEQPTGCGWVRLAVAAATIGTTRYGCPSDRKS